jgi:hypothetical protein
MCCCVSVRVGMAMGGGAGGMALVVLPWRWFCCHDVGSDAADTVPVALLLFTGVVVQQPGYFLLYKRAYKLINYKPKCNRHARHESNMRLSPPSPPLVHSACAYAHYTILEVICFGLDLSSTDIYCY